MKIIQLIYSLGNGGAEKFTVELSNELANDHQVSLYTFIKNEDWMIPPTNLNSNVNNDFLNLHKKFSIYNFIILYRLLKKQKPNVVHVQSSIALLNAYLLPLFFPKTKFILTIHSTLTENYTKAFNILSKLFFIKKKWKHVCISQSILADFSIKFKGFKFYSIDNGIAPITTSDYLTKVEKELNDLSTNINNTRIIAIGNYSDFKRFDLLVDVVNELNNEGKNLDLFIIGEDNSKDKINYNKVLAKKTEHIHLLGLRNNIADYMSFVDVLVISSSHEGMPLVVIEGHHIQKEDCFTFVRICRIGISYKKSILDSLNLIEHLISIGIENIRLVIIGSIENLTFFEQLKNHKLVQKGLIQFFTDNIYTKEASKMLSIADAVIGTGRSFMESASLSIPLLTINSKGNIPVLINQDNFHYAFKTNFSERNIFPNYVERENIYNIIELINNKIYYKKMCDFSRYLFDYYFNVDLVTLLYKEVYEKSVYSKKKHLLVDAKSIIRSIINITRQNIIYRRSVIKKL